MARNRKKEALVSATPVSSTLSQSGNTISWVIGTIAEGDYLIWTQIQLSKNGTFLQGDCEVFQIYQGDRAPSYKTSYTFGTASELPALFITGSYSCRLITVTGSILDSTDRTYTVSNVVSLSLT